MGLFSKKKKTDKDGNASPAPSFSSSSTLPTIPQPVRPTMRLRVMVDSMPQGRETGEDTFTLDVDLEDNVNMLRKYLSRRLGDVGMAIFKVNIPVQAFEQAVKYRQIYNKHVNLVTRFPAYCMDDPQQLACSLGSPSYMIRSTNIGPAPVMINWFPLSVNEVETISILVRTCPSTLLSTIPITLIAHYAPNGTSTSSRRSSANSSPATHPTREPPTPIDVSPTSTIRELKDVLLMDRSKQICGESREKVTLWQVDMTEREMIVIEERGGLKSGQMPWPYPPTAEVPVQMAEESFTISDYFPNFNSNPTRSVNFSVWIHPSVESIASSPPMSSSSSSSEGSEIQNDIPIFRYPMIFPTDIVSDRRPSACHSLPPSSPAVPPEIVITNAAPAGLGGAKPLSSVKSAGTGSGSKGRRCRPSTAPAAVDSPTGTPTQNSFGFGGIRSLRGKSPLGPPSAGSPQLRGLGLDGATTDPREDVNSTPKASEYHNSMKSIKERKESESDGMVNGIVDDLGRLKVHVGEAIAGLNVNGLNGHGQGNDQIIWHAAEQRPQFSKSDSFGIRSVASNKALRAYEIY